VFLNPDLLSDAEARLGAPRLFRFDPIPTSRSEWADLLAILAPGRRHDAVFAARSAAGRFAVMRKPTYPVGAWRLPGGGVETGETLDQGAARELAEETGLALRAERYLLRATVAFAVDGVAHGWTTHVFFADAPVETSLAPTGVGEAVAECAWVDRDALAAAGPRFRATGSAALAYRAALQDLVLEILSDAGARRRPAPKEATS